MALRKSQLGMRMWSFSEMSLPWATWLSDAANVALLFSLLAGVLATFLIVRTGGVKESHWDKERNSSRERIVELGTETERAKADLENARADIAEAVKQTESARAVAAEANRKAEEERLERLKLEAIVVPRSLSLDQQRAIAGLWKPFSGKRVSVTTYSLDAEGASLATQIMASLSAATIEVDNRVATIMPLGGFSIGVHVSGDDVELAKAIRSALSVTGRILVAPPNAETENWRMATTPKDGNKPVAASILVGVKPVATIR